MLFEMEQILRQVVIEAGPKHYAMKIARDPALLQWMKEQTAQHGDLTIPVMTRVILHGESPVCPLGRSKRWISIDQGFGFCGRAAACQCCAESVSKSVAEAKNKTTPQEREITTNRRRATVLAKYGAESVSHVKQIQERRRNTFQDRYGVDSPLALREVRERGMLAKHGVRNPAQMPGMIARSRETYLERTGFDHPMRNPEVVQRAMDRNRATFVENIREGKIAAGWENLLKLLPEGIVPGFDRDSYVGYVQSKEWVSYPWKCLECEGTFNRVLVRPTKLSCPNCRPQDYQSDEEREVGDYLISIGVDVRRNDKSLINPYELDIVNDRHKVAVEYSRLYWHSQNAGGKHPEYHLEKLRRCESKGYRLITIFSDEWLLRRPIVENRLRALFGRNERGPGARRLRIETIAWSVAAEFLEVHHIQGSGVPGFVSYGGYEGDRLCAVMTFGKARIALGRSGGEPELLRFATDGRHYAGIASRLLGIFVREHRPMGVVSYADRRWSTGNLYEKIGFAKVSLSRPSYFYVRDYIVRENRFAYRKSVLVERYGASRHMSEWETMQNMGFDRVWDCGSIKYLLRQ